MSFNKQPNDREVALSTFGGKVSESNPSDLPDGVSPDCSDMEFVPGSVFSRRGLRKVFDAALYPLATRTYGKSYVDPVGVIRNLYLYSNGIMTVENVSAAPGIETVLTTTAAGSYAKSVTAFGREYIAVSDGLNGTDIPLQLTALSDGTLQLDRVTQDGPGAPPNINSIAIPAVSMAVSGAPGTLAITEVDPAGISGSGGFYTRVDIFVTSGAGTVAPGDIVTVSGTTGTFNGSYTVIASFDPTLIIAAAYFPPGTGFYLGPGTLTISSGITMARAGNLVTVNTAAPHQMQPGYQAQISGVPASTVGTSISSIVINNENSPGIATVTTANPHGLVPGLFVSLIGIAGTAVGGGATSAARAGQVTTVTTASPHGLSPGSVFTSSGFANPGFNTTAIVAQVTGLNTFTFFQADTDATDTTGTITLNWPIPNTPTPSYFEVIAAPSATTFQVVVNYSDGSWTGGTVKYAWDGTFYVQSVPSPTSFIYQQYGPNATTSTVGIVTPFGQASPGKHQLQVAFLTRQFGITRSSPPVQFISNGGQYLAVSNIPIGPPNVIARLLLFTGASGAYFFYIPTPPQVNGQLVGTATQINDNTTTSVVLDFSDNTLFAAIGVSVQGNNLANQITLEGALSFGFSGERLVTYGQRNRVQSLLNTGFDGGFLPSTPAVPTGWVPSDSRGSLTNGHYGSGWLINVGAGFGPCGKISQSFYADYNGSPIATGNTRYKVRVWLRPTATVADLTFVVAITSTLTGFSSTASIVGTSMNVAGSFLEAQFTVRTPISIPPDMQLSLYGTSSATNVTLLVDELSIIYSDTPYLNNILYGSYVDNPEGFDGVSGKFGPSQDTHKVMELGIIRNSLYLLTQEPSGRLHEVINNGVTEPSGWEVDEVGANCGIMSAFGLTKSQADDASASGGEEWFAWASSSGVRIFGGGEPWKISQEIQPDWESINKSAWKTVWAVNDPVARLMLFGLPIGAATAPNSIYTLNYRELDSASQIAAAAPVHISASGRLSAHDNARKWCPWDLAMNGGALMYRDAGTLPGRLPIVLFNGNGLTPNTSITGAFGQVYTLDPAKLTDDDYGIIAPYYVTYFFITPEQAQALQLGQMRLMVSYLSGQVSGVGNVTITAYVNNLNNPQNQTCVRTLDLVPNYDLEYPGASYTGNRIAFRIASSPLTDTTDNALAVQKLVPVMRSNVRLPVRGKA